MHAKSITARELVMGVLSNHDRYIVLYYDRMHDRKVIAAAQCLSGILANEGDANGVAVYTFRVDSQADLIAMGRAVGLEQVSNIGVVSRADEETVHHTFDPGNLERTARQVIKRFAEEVNA